MVVAAAAVAGGDDPCNCQSMITGRQRGERDSCSSGCSSRGGGGGSAVRPPFILDPDPHDEGKRCHADTGIIINE